MHVSPAAHAAVASPDFLGEVVAELRKLLPPENVETWFRGLRLLNIGDGEVEFSVPSGFVRDWLTRNFLPCIAEAVAAVRKQTCRIKLSLHKSEPERELSGDVSPSEPGAAEQPARAIESSNGHPPAEAPADRAASANGHGAGWSIVPAAKSTGTVRSAPRHECHLNSNYTFENFVVGPCNRLSHAAALAIGDNPGRAYNPLFIHGNTGLGKTHLLQATCHVIRLKQEHASVVYLSCEDFTNRFIQSIQTGRLDDFRGYHRGIDVLVIDDIQFLANKEKTQEEFFHTFNALYNSSRQIIISSDRSPLEIPTIEERLVSRFKWGLVAEMEVPCFETRVAIVQRKARTRGLLITDDIAHFVAERIDTNIRELEGAVIKIIGFASITEREITVELAEEALRDVVKPRNTQINLADIMDLVTREFSISARDLTGKSRTQAVSLPRQICMYLCRSHTDQSLEEIGRFFGNRDHTTVLYAVQKIKRRVKEDRMFRDLLGSMSGRLQSALRG